ncbi:hypothetical protein M1M25_gp088 [Tenacibaculum phage Gundel_1]|uniref:Uncharacterized protein n=1 Tax=Tenacibaculum phage Gundel_1 TaxID=2745672 RepID=A0A8E5E9U7_9CAUD|nr:hypothetical protein M1M25_gp088 [Tenacibaculum phage Gundel_1]QQV91525.1 hypothetical protein Gundel1_88 [Tenacibaculum phage Gundel_1]
MSKRFKTTGNYFVVGDTETGLEEIREAKGNISYKELQGSILFFLVSTGIKISANLYNKDNIVNGDSNDAPFADIAALKKYLDDNTAFSSASGSSGALSIPDKFIFETNTARDTYFTSNPTEKTTGLNILVKQPQLVIERWNGSSWDSSTTVIKGDDGVGLKNILKGIENTNTGAISIAFMTTDGKTYLVETPPLKGDKGLPGDKGDTGEVSLAELQKYPQEAYSSYNYIRRLTRGRGWVLVAKFRFDSSKVKITNVNCLVEFQKSELTADTDYIFRNANNTLQVYFYKSNIGRLDGFNIINLTKSLSHTNNGILDIEVIARKTSSTGKTTSYSVDVTFEGINS